MKQLIIALLIVLISACTHERTNRMLTQYGDSQPDLLGIGEQSTEATAEISLEIIEKRKQVADLAKKNHGLMHIHRYGPGFDVLMTLDTGDSDVSFSMALPSTPGSLQDSLRSDLQKSAEEIAEQNKQVLESLDDDKAELHHEELDERSELIEQKKIQDFQASTKHIFSAQSLFYKKQYWQSLDETNKALELVPDSAQAHALKGSIYYKMGLSAEAKASWQQALEIDPTMEQVKTSLTRLK
ncbi:MAG: tetratricopeptide repeat protein [Oleispira antarctica]|nr:tetratricopeptide repeat protein [Oleispira antarctica]MBQ0793902.1 tetratricopeptide repeat protein [Oleispira antarctica]